MQSAFLKARSAGTAFRLLLMPGLLAGLLAGCPARRGLDMDAGGTGGGPGGAGGMARGSGGTGVGGTAGAGPHGSGGVAAGTGGVAASGGVGSNGTGGSAGTGSGTGGASPPGTGGNGAGGGAMPGAAALAIQPSTNDFDMVVVGTPSEAPLDITNTGGSASGPVTVSVTGADFTITANTCTAGLAPGAHCTATVRFLPATMGAASGTLTATASPGGTATATLKGTGIALGALSITPTSSPFGSVAQGATSTPVTFTVTNTGQAATGALTATIAGSADFKITTNNCDGKSLAGAGTCTVAVVFTPSVAGSRSGTLRATASPGGTASAALTGMGLRPAVLSASPTGYDFGSIEAGVASAPTTITITNTGDIATGPLMLTNSAPTEVTATNGCTAALAAGASCTLMVTFKPSTGELRGASLAVSGSPGGTVTISLSAQGMFRLTVANTGTGTITSSPAGISCGTTCTGLFPSGTVGLQARPTNGSNMRFAGWSGGGCSGVGNACSVALTASTTVTTSFVAVTANLIFESSATFTTNLGAVTNYDAKCNAEATAVGINDTSGAGYVAFISSAASLATARLGSARGWVNMEGKPVIDTVAAAFGSYQVFNAVTLNENGVFPQDGSWVITGLSVDGTVNPDGTCASWTNTTGNASGGSPTSGAHDWGANTTGSCSLGGHLLCMGKTRSATLGPTVTSGKRIWLSTNEFVIGASGTPDTFCQADRPAGVTTAVALIATTSRSAASLLGATTNYVRPDGTLVGTGASIGAGTPLTSGIWQFASGAYSNALYDVWTGSPSPSAAGTLDSTCANWTDGSSTVEQRLTGAATSVTNFWTWNSYLSCNFGSAHLYCVQTAP